MTNLQILSLSFIQGLTEFLPVSSSGHLILLSKFTNFPDQGIFLDVAVHVGSIIAVMIYFWREIWDMLKGLCTPKFNIPGAKLAWLIIIATIPAVIAGLALKNYGLENIRSTKLIGWNLIIYGIILYISDRFCKTSRKTNDLTIKDAIIIGCAQCLALIPGTSRSGVTITASRFLGIERREAAKFCMLLSIPTIAGAGLLMAIEIIQAGDLSKLYDAYTGIVYSFIASLGAIYIMMTWLKKWTFAPFVIYRLILGLYLLLDAYNLI